MTAANRYAAALFALAQDDKSQKATATAANTLAEAVKDASLASTLANPRLTPAQRTQLAASMAKATKAPIAFANTLSVLAANNRLAVLPQVLAAYQDLNDTASGVTRVQLTSAVPLTDAQRTKIADLIKKHSKATEVRLEESLDATLKGGFRAFFNGQVWDASLSGQLARMSTRLRNVIAQRQN